MSMQWDEVNHFNGGLLLIRGQFQRYIETSSFYPPMFNLVTALYFGVAGASVFTGRLVAVTFSLLTLVVLYKIARGMYGAKTALLSAVLFAVMPGIVWLSRMAMIETMLIFAFSLCMLFFFRWLTTHQDRDRKISIAAFAVGVAVKYQTLVVAPIIMIASLLVFGRGDYLKAQLASLLKPRRLAVVAAAAAVAASLVYVLYASGILNVWLYAIQVGTADKSLYSVRFPVPVFYLVEMTWPYSDVHPISLLLYAAGLAGLGLFAYRRKPGDKLLLLWFIAVYALFTVIPNRQWRYVTLLFPVLAISASTLLVSAYGKAHENWQKMHRSLPRRAATKLAAAVLIAFAATGVFFSCLDAYSWVAKDQIQVPIEQATAYAAQTLSPNQSIAIACPLNFLNNDMVWFYLNVKAPSQSEVWQYPKLAVDAYKPDFNLSEFTSLCQQHKAKYVLLYEYGGTARYFQTELTPNDVYNTLIDSGNFTSAASYGDEPKRVFVLTFTPEP
jgi:4-amino-4-deoxy-L-arabinose transferase-like glycosyltransferase